MRELGEIGDDLNVPPDHLLHPGRSTFTITSSPVWSTAACTCPREGGGRAGVSSNCAKSRSRGWPSSASMVPRMRSKGTAGPLSWRWRSSEMYSPGRKIGAGRRARAELDEGRAQRGQGQAQPPRTGQLPIARVLPGGAEGSNRTSSGRRCSPARIGR